MCPSVWRFWRCVADQAPEPQPMEDEVGDLYLEVDI